MHRFAYALVVIALGVLGAHFYRSADFLLVAITIAAALLLLVRQAWALRVVQIALVLGALEWLRTLAALVAQRTALQMPYGRLVAILAAVALLTALAALLLELAPVRKRYRRRSSAAASNA